MARIPLVFTVASFPEGWSGNPQELANKIAELLIAEIEAEFLSGQVGGTPSPTAGLWIHQLADSNESNQASWYSEKYAKYLPLYSMPVGSVIMYAGSDTPPDYLECDGAEYTVVSKPQLYDAIGITWGGVINTKFNVPDMRGRVPIGKGTGVDYLSDNAPLQERLMGNPDSYQGHDFIHYVEKVPNGPNTPTKQRVAGASFKPPGPQGSFSSAVTAGLPPATVLRFLIKYQ
jgi:hypothetical protein